MADPVPLFDRSPPASPDFNFLTYVCKNDGTDDGPISIFQLLALMSYLLTPEDSIEIGDDLLTIRLKGNFWQLFANGELVAQADDTGWQFKVIVTGINREIGDGDSPVVLNADEFVSYKRTDAADLEMPDAADMQISQKLTIFNASEDTISLVWPVGLGCWMGGTGTELILQPGCSVTFQAMNKPGAGGILGVIAQTGAAFPE